MTISRYICAHCSIQDFEYAATGPGIYLLYQGQAKDGNIEYIGRSMVDVMVRVRDHLRTKDFDRVGLILPQCTSELRIKSLEAIILHQYRDAYGQLPPANHRIEYRPDGAKAFNWTQMPRRRGDVLFE